MVVDPTSHEVTLTYGSTGADDLGLVLTIVGILVVVELIRRRSFIAGWSPLGHRRDAAAAGRDSLWRHERPRCRLQGV